MWGLILWSAGISVAVALIGYDCETPSLNITTIGLDEVGECSQDPGEYESALMEVQVVQREEIRKQLVRCCLIEVIRVMHHCGMASHSSTVAGGVTTYIHNLGEEECAQVHRHRSMIFYGHYIDKLVINGTSSASVVMFGTVAMDGSCKGGTFTENDRTWEDVTVQGALKITLSESFATVKLDANEILLPGGVVCPYLRGYCIDSIYGETVWSISPKKNCDDVVTLYKGNARHVYDKRREISYMVVEDQDRVFALTLVAISDVCGRAAWQTEHPKILVVNIIVGHSVGNVDHTSTENPDLLTYINSKFLYVEQSFKRQLEKVYIDTVSRRCQVHRQILKNRLMGAPLSPSTIGWIIKQQPGYIGRVLGEVLYLLKCTPRPAELRRSEHCYNEPPISVNNQSRFLSPLTHIILTHAEEIDCSPLTPPMFFINNRWVGLTPEPVLRDAPVRLQPEREDKLWFDPIHPLGGGGLYTNAEVSRSQRILLFGTERRAVENVMARKITGEVTDNQGLHSLRLFDEEELKTLARSTMHQLWGWFTDFGVVVSGLMGIYVILQLFKYLLGVTINSYQIYRTVGCGLSLLAALWDTLTLMVLHRHLSAKTPQDTEMTEVLVNRDRPQPSAPTMLPTSRHWTERPNC